VLFYVGVIRTVPKGVNDMIDTFKSYAEDLGAKIIGGDALLMISSAILAMLYKLAPPHLTYSIVSVVLYMLPYAIYTKNPYSVVEEVKKEEKKEEFKDPKLDAYKRMVGMA
jgi:ABC-type antimicrobial peptide transport system permease subunit